jgi:hypothetical protein
MHNLFIAIHSLQLAPIEHTCSVSAIVEINFLFVVNAHRAIVALSVTAVVRWSIVGAFSGSQE